MRLNNKGLISLDRVDTLSEAFQNYAPFCVEESKRE